MANDPTPQTPQETLVSCDYCSDDFPKESLIEHSNITLCETCEEDHFQCCDCFDYCHSDDKITDNNNNLYCQDCADSSLFWCGRCESYLSNDDMVTLQATTSRQTTTYCCESCATNTHFRCESCNTWHDNDYASTGPDDNLYCESCSGELIGYCNRCNDIVWREETQYDEDSGEDYCSDCFEASTTLRGDSGGYKKLYSETFEKNPHKRLVGFELEFIVPSAANVDLTGFGKLHEDGSLKPDNTSTHKGREFSSHAFNGDRLLEAIKEISTRLLAADGSVNTTCGFHVHIDMTENMTEWGRRNVWRAFQTFEKVFMGMISDSRQDNTYCKQISFNTIIITHKILNSRYYTLNLAAFPEHGTFEFRLHQGTLNHERIINWIMLLLNFVETFARIDMTDSRLLEIMSMTPREKLRILFMLMPTPFGIRRYMLRRLDKFKRFNYKCSDQQAISATMPTYAVPLEQAQTISSSGITINAAGSFVAFGSTS